MSNTATLGLEVRATGAKEAANDLNALVGAAAKAEKASDNVGKASAAASQKMGMGSKAVERLLQAIEKVEKAVRDQERAMARMGAGMGQAAAGVSKVSVAANAAATQVERLTTISTGAVSGIGMLGTNLGQVSQSAQAANNNFKLTGNQLRNMSFQINDAATMALSGASAFQILATQGGQVFQVLQEGPNGIKGSMMAIGQSILRLITPMNLVIAGFTAAAGAAVYFAYKSTQKIKPLNEAMAAHAAAIKAVAASYDIAIDANARYTSKAQNAFASRQSAADLRLSARTSLLDSGFAGGGDMTNVGRTDDGGRVYEAYKKYEAFAAPLVKLAEGLRAGTDDARAFVDEVARIADQDPANRKLQELAKGLIDLARPAADAAAQLDLLADSMLRVQQARISEAANSFKEFLPNTKTAAETINERYQARIAAIGALPSSQRGASEGMRIAAANDLKKALEELDRVEANRRAGYELDIRAIGARTAEEKAAIAAERERLALADENITSSEKERRVEEARTLSLTESQQALSEAMRARVASGQAQVEQMELEQSLVGKSAAETARLRAEYEMLAAAKEAARAAGTIVDPAEEAAIKAQADRIGELTAAMQKLNFERDLQFRLEQAGRSEPEQRIAQEVRGYGEDINTASGQAMAAQLRYVASVEKTADELKEMREIGRDAFLDIVDAIGSGENAMDSLIGTLASFGKQMASMGAKKLFDGLFSGAGAANDNSAGGFSGIFGAITQAASKPKTATEIFGGGQTYAAAPTIAVQRASLPALVTGEGFSASAASSVAGKSVPVQMWNFFAGKGLASHQIAGILGNAKAESAFNPGAVGDGGAALGLFQWNDRSSAMKSSVGSDWKSDVNGQLEFAWNELQTSESKAYRALLKATDVTQATEAFLGFERPSGYNTGVQNSHNYSGRVANAKEALGAYGGASNDNSIATGVASGMKSYGQAVSSGAAPSLLGNLGGFSSAWQPVSGTGPTAGVDPWAGLRTATGGASATSGGGIMGGLGGIMQSPIVGLGMTALGAGAAGYQSGSPVGGALSGVLGGLATGNPIAAVVGGIGGLLGGIFGGKAKRKAEHQAKADEWAAMSPEWTAFQEEMKTGTGNPHGLRQLHADLETQMSGFVMKGSAAWKMGSNNSSALFAQVGADREAYLQRTTQLFIDQFQTAIDSLNRGDGLTSKFDEIRESVSSMAADLVTFLDDTDGALANPKSYAEAQKASQNQLLSIFEGAAPLSAVAEAMEQVKVAASVLPGYLVQLGMSAEDAGVAVNEKLNTSLKRIGSDFQQGLQDSIDDLDGKGYLSDFRALMEDSASLLKDANLTNVDTSLVDTFFQKQAQSLVDGSEIAGSAFDELIQMFPDLTGKVHAFADVAEVVIEAGRSAAEIAARMQSANDRYFSATTDTSTLAGANAAFNRSASVELQAEAASGGGAMLQLQAAQAAERVVMIQGLLNQARQEEVSQIEETISRLESFRDSVSDLRKSLLLDDNLSPLSQQDQFLEAQRQFRDLSAKAAGGDEDAQAKLAGISQSYLEEAKAYYASSEDYYSAFNEVQGVLAHSETLAQQQLNAAKSQLDIAKAQLDATIGVKDSIASLTAALAAAQAAAAVVAPAMGGLPAAGTTAPATTGGMPGGSYSVSTKSAAYLAKNADVVAAIAAGNTFGLPAGLSPEVYASAHYGLYGQKEGRGWSTGGFTGVGGMQEPAGTVHKGEVVWSQPDIARWGGVANVEGMRVSAMPRVPAIAMPRVAANSDGQGMAEMAAELKRVNAKLDRLTAVTAEGDLLNAKVTREGNASQQDLARTAARKSA